MKIEVIAEIGSNWEGNLDLAKKHIKKSWESGATFVKFQMWRARDLYSESHPEWNSIQKSELKEEDAKELKKFADKIGIKWFCTPFNPEAVDFLESINVQLYKIASRTSTFNDKFALETIEKIANTKKPIFISTGEGANKQKISSLFHTPHPQFTYCISKYPTKDIEIDWKEILKYDFFSDHSLGITIPLVYASLKKCQNKKNIYIEKHVKLEENIGPDASFAINYKEFSTLINNLKRIEKLNILKEYI
jgi:N,N'-diacetyllegionaminate synthase